MHSVWKYTAPTSDTFTIDTRRGAKILSVAVQGNALCVWAEVDPEAPAEARRFRLCGTGHPIPADEPRQFVGTVMTHSGALVFHLFELETPKAES